MTHPFNRPDSVPGGPATAGVVVLTTRAGEHVQGVTPTGFSALTLAPLLVVASVHPEHSVLSMVRRSKVFAVSVLASHQHAVASHFASTQRPVEAGAFARVAAAAQVTGSPVVHGCLAWYDCGLETILAAGDHVLLVGRVRAAGGSGGEPLVVTADGYGALQDFDDEAGASLPDAAPSGAQPDPQPVPSAALDAMTLGWHLAAPDAGAVSVALQALHIAAWTAAAGSGLGPQAGADAARAGGRRLLDAVRVSLERAGGAGATPSA